MSAENRNDDLFQNFRDGIEGFGRKVSSFVDEVFSGEGMGEVKLRIDLYHTSDSLVVELELPGVKKEDVKIQVQDRALHIRGQKLPPEDMPEYEYVLRERRFGSFMKEIALPENIELENIKARFESGLLTVRFPHQAGTRPAGDGIDID